jgi:hypothetical protein
LGWAEVFLEWVYDVVVVDAVVAVAAAAQAERWQECHPQVYSPEHL